MTDRQPTIMELFDRIELPESNNELEDFPEEEILPENVNTTDQKELINAYAAGFFDGEGYIGTYEQKLNNPPTILLKTMIGCTDLQILTKLKQEYCGKIYIHKKRKGKEHHKQAWHWDIKDRSTLKKFLTQILPYSQYKKPQIELGLTFIQLKDSINGKATQEQYNIMKNIHEEFKRLKNTQLSSCEINDFNTQIQEMNVDKNQLSLLDLLDSNKKDIEIIKVETEPEKIKPTYYSKELINAYTAGFFDGEGYIGTDEQKLNNLPTIRLTTQLSNTDNEILKKFKQEFGGEICMKKKKNGIEHYKQSWSWNIQNRPTIKKFLTQILPYSQYKKPQIELGLTFIQLKDSINGKATQEQYNLMKKIHEEFKRLKHTELSVCELTNFNTQIKEMNVDKYQKSMMDF